MEKAKRNKIHTDEDDRISQMPEEILHRILDFSRNTKATAKTCVLSKAWRYVWCTNPKLNLSRNCVSALDRILQSYRDRNLFLEEFSLRVSDDNEEVLLLHKWIPMIMQDMRVKTFRLTLVKRNKLFLELPSSILESDHILKLTILSEDAGFMFKSSPRVELKHLQTLSLRYFYISEHILDSILSSCLLLERVSLEHCMGFTRIKMLTNNKQPNTNLAAFSFSGCYSIYDDVSVEIEDPIPTLETMELQSCLFSISRNKPLEYARLTRLILTRVKLSSGSFSCNLHSLEVLKLVECSGIEEFILSSRSMKRLSISYVRTPFKATIDAPSIVRFNYKGGILPQSISFASTTSNDHLWKSKIYLQSSFSYDDDDEYSHCFNEIYGLLKALGQSKISLELGQIEIRRFHTQSGSTKNDHIVGVSEEAKHELPVAVEHLFIQRSDYEHVDSCADPFLNMLFHMFRPRFVYMDDNDMLIMSYNEHRKIADLLFKERDQTGQSYFWPPDLVGASLKVLNRNQSKWQTAKYTYKFYRT